MFILYKSKIKLFVPDGLCGSGICKVTQYSLLSSQDTVIVSSNNHGFWFKMNVKFQSTVCSTLKLLSGYKIKAHLNSMAPSAVNTKKSNAMGTCSRVFLT